MIEDTQSNTSISVLLSKNKIQVAEFTNTKTLDLCFWLGSEVSTRADREERTNPQTCYLLLSGQLIHYMACIWKERK